MPIPATNTAVWSAPADHLAPVYAQWPLEQKRARADFVIDNSVPVEDLPAEVESLIRKLGLMA